MPKISGAWFLFKWGLPGYWWPVTWQGYLLMFAEGLSIAGGVSLGLALIERGFGWGRYVAFGSAFLLLVLFLFSLRKTRRV